MTLFYNNVIVTEIEEKNIFILSKYIYHESKDVLKFF